MSLFTFPHNLSAGEGSGFGGDNAPYRGSDGHLYIVGRESGGAISISLFRSTNNGETWAKAVQLWGSGGTGDYASDFVGDKLHVARQNHRGANSQAQHFIVPNITATTPTTSNSQVQGSLTTGAFLPYLVDTTVSSDNRVWQAVNGPRESLMGQSYDNIALFVSHNGGSTWPNWFAVGVAGAQPNDGGASGANHGYPALTASVAMTGYVHCVHLEDSALRITTVQWDPVGSAFFVGAVRNTGITATVHRPSKPVVYGGNVYFWWNGNVYQFADSTTGSVSVATALAGDHGSVAVDGAGNLHATALSGGALVHRAYNGSSWSAAATISSAPTTQARVYQRATASQLLIAVSDSSGATVLTGTHALGGGGGTPQTIPVGQATEADVAQPLVVVNPRSTLLGQAAEADQSFALTVGQAAPLTVPVGQAAEADVAQPLVVVNPRSTLLGQAAEADQSFALTVGQAAPLTVPVGQAAEADVAQPLVVVNPRSTLLGQAAEADSADAAILRVTSPWSTPVTVLTGSQPQTIPVGQAPETDSADALLVDNPRTYLLGQAAEVDVAQPAITLNPRSTLLAQASETDSVDALSVANPRSALLGQAAEVDVARDLTVGLATALVLGQATEADAAHLVTVVNPRTIPLVPATESNYSPPTTVENPRSYLTDQAAEVDVAQPVVAVNPRSVLLGQAAEANQALGLHIDGPRSYELGRATESNDGGDPLGLVTPRTYAVGQAAETNVAHPVVAVNPRSTVLGQASEADVAEPLTLLNPRTHTVGQAAEANQAQAITLVAPRTYQLEQAVEADVAQAIAVLNARAYALEVALESDSADSVTVLNPRTVTLEQAQEADAAFALAVYGVVTGSVVRMASGGYLRSAAGILRPVQE
jgi:hypothetical protein